MKALILSVMLGDNEHGVEQHFYSLKFNRQWLHFQNLCFFLSTQLMHVTEYHGHLSFTFKVRCTILEHLTPSASTCSSDVTVHTVYHIF